MNNIFSITVSSFLIFFCLNGYAHENNSTKIAQIFEETIYLNELEIDLQFINAYKSSYPKLSEDEILDKMRLSKLSSIIWEQIYLELSQKHDLEPTIKEVESLTHFLKSHSLNPAYTKTTTEHEEFSQNTHKSFVKTYKVSKYLYETYGGTVIFQQGNPQEPVGAYRKLLETYAGQGKFEIFAVKYKKGFWNRYLKEYSMVIPQDKVDFSKPWWESAKNK